MKGKHEVIVSNRDVKFTFTLNRNITVVRGKSATGKTTLYEMIAEYTRLGDKSGVNIKCDKKCAAIVYEDWLGALKKIKDSIVFIDEDQDFVNSHEFAQAAKNSDNYYVIFNREGMHELPYSVEEIYEIRSKGKYHTFSKMYRFDDNHLLTGRNRRTVKNDIFLTEDSGAGFEFYRDYFKDSDIICASSSSNSNIFSFLKEHKDKKILIVADGAAFGSEIDRIIKLQDTVNFRLYLPESFEWLILRSGLIKNDELGSMLDDPSEHIESSEHFSWEIFFEKYLIKATKDKVNKRFKYEKGHINPVYLIAVHSKAIVKEIFPETE
ncbi:MAG: translation initiation factor 2 [Oscillospiraceae bacterium]|nr:translation initiation factor 2 [Oscillospiraceae bacterium]